MDAASTDREKWRQLGLHRHAPPRLKTTSTNSFSLWTGELQYFYETAGKAGGRKRMCKILFS